MDTGYTTHHMPNTSALSKVAGAAARSSRGFDTIARAGPAPIDAAGVANAGARKGLVFKYAADGSRSIRKSAKGWAAVGLGGAVIATPLGGILGQGAGNAVGGIAGGLLEGLSSSGALVPCISSSFSLGCILVLVLMMMLMD